MNKKQPASITRGGITFLTVNQAIGLSLCLGVIWLWWIDQLMIADVWDETNGILLLTTEPLIGSSPLEALRIFWLHELPLNIYRPLGSSLFFLLAQATDGNFVILRYFNSLLLLAAIGLITSVLFTDRNVKPWRCLAFFTLGLFSASAAITAGWFANIFDASCLFLIALSLRLLVSNGLMASALCLSLAAFCKEAYVLAFPLFFFLIGQLQNVGWRQLILPVSLVLFSSLLYWFLRHSMVPIGSPEDLHGFAPEQYRSSTLSFLGGFLSQSSKFSLWDISFSLGLSALALCLISLRNQAVVLAVGSMLVMCSVVYWGMFGYRATTLMGWEIFIGRLYLVPYLIFLFFLCKYGDWRVFPVLLCFNLWGSVTTVSDYRIFQQTYAEIYKLASETEGRLEIHFPGKPLEDPKRNLSIGNYPDSELRIDVVNGGLL